MVAELSCITAVMVSEIVQRPKWEIDRILESLIGQEIRVAAHSFCPASRNSKLRHSWIRADELVLADNTSVSGLPVHFEGRLSRFRREIGIVCVVLDAPGILEKSAEGVICFRSAIAVFLRGPVQVELAFPFRVEKLPHDESNYWNDLKFP